MDIKFTSSQTFFAEKIFPHLDEVYNYQLLLTNDERSSEKLLIKTAKEANWFSGYLSPETNTRIWLLRVMMKNEDTGKHYDNDETNSLQTEQVIDLSKFDKDCIEHKGTFETGKEIREAISKLPYLLRQVLVLADILKFNFEQTADLIDVPVGVVVTRLFDARKLLLINLTLGNSALFLPESSEITRDDKKNIIVIVDKHINAEQNDDKQNFESEIEAQLYVKSLFKKYIFVQSIRPAIQKKIAGKFAPQLKNEIEKLNSSEGRGIVAAATVAMIIFAAVFIFVKGPGIVNPVNLADEQKGENNILVQLEKNYELLIDHKFDSLMVNLDDNPAEKYLRESVPGNQPVILNLDGWYLSDYFIREFNNTKLINLIYKNNSGSILYTYQVPTRLIEKENSITLTEDLLDYLHSENCFVTRKGETIYLLKIINENIIGVAGRNLDKNLLAEICNRASL